MFADFSYGIRFLIPQRPISRIFEHILDEKISPLVRRLMQISVTCGLHTSNKIKRTRENFSNSILKQNLNEQQFVI